MDLIKLYCKLPIKTTLNINEKSVEYDFGIANFIEVPTEVAKKYAAIENLFYLVENKSIIIDRNELISEIHSIFETNENVKEIVNLLKDEKFESLNLTLKGNYGKKESLLRTIIEQL